MTHLIPDIYSVKVESPGFKISQQTDIHVPPMPVQTWICNSRWAEPPRPWKSPPRRHNFKTDRADVATSFNERYVEDVPILNRNFTTAALHGAGLAEAGRAGATPPPRIRKAASKSSPRASTSAAPAFELDGTDNQDPILGIIVVNPNLDAVTEAKVALQNYDAEFGKAVSSVVTAQTKSGSNEHSRQRVLLFGRSDAKHARDPFAQCARLITGTASFRRSRWQQFGGTIGGPIIKDKLFFFGDYQGTRQTQRRKRNVHRADGQGRTICNRPQTGERYPWILRSEPVSDGGRRWGPGIRSDHRRSHYGAAGRRLPET